MNEKKYSIRELQRIANLSPGDLRDLINKNRQHLTLEMLKNSEGQEEMFIDQPSFERLMFIKHLVFGSALSHEEALSHLEEPQKTMDEAKCDPCSILLSSLEQLAEGVRTVKGKMDYLYIKYNQVIRDLQDAKTDNLRLKKELEALRENQSILAGKLKQTIDDSEDGSSDTIN